MQLYATRHRLFRFTSTSTVSGDIPELQPTKLTETHETESLPLVGSVLPLHPFVLVAQGPNSPQKIPLLFKIGDLISLQSPGSSLRSINLCLKFLGI